MQKYTTKDGIEVTLYDDGEIAYKKEGKQVKEEDTFGKYIWAKNFFEAIKEQDRIDPIYGAFKTTYKNKYFPDRDKVEVELFYTVSEKDTSSPRQKKTFCFENEAKALRFQEKATKFIEEKIKSGISYNMEDIEEIYVGSDSIPSIDALLYMENPVIQKAKKEEMVAKEAFNYVDVDICEEFFPDKDAIFVAKIHDDAICEDILDMVIKKNPSINKNDLMGLLIGESFKKGKNMPKTYVSDGQVFFYDKKNREILSTTETQVLLAEDVTVLGTINKKGEKEFVTPNIRSIIGGDSVEVTQKLGL